MRCHSQGETTGTAAPLPDGSLWPLNKIMEYIFTGKIVLSTPIQKRFVEILLQEALGKVNFSPIEDTKAFADEVEVRIKK